MVSKYSSKSDLYRDFLLCVKYRIPEYRPYDKVHDLLREMGWAQETSLERIREDIVYQRDDDNKGQSDIIGDLDHQIGAYGMVLLTPEGDEVAVLEHETGPEVWIIPIATFIGGAIVSGIIGNAAYDLIHKLYIKLGKAWERTGPIEDDYYRHFYISIKVRTPENETVDLTQQCISRKREIVRRTVLIRMIQLGIEVEEVAEANTLGQPVTLQKLEKRIKRLEEQMGTIVLKYRELASQFQKERETWQRQSTHVNR
jgi:hypothetical protein